MHNLRKLHAACAACIVLALAASGCAHDTPKANAPQSGGMTRAAWQSMTPDQQQQYLNKMRQQQDRVAGEMKNAPAPAKPPGN